MSDALTDLFIFSKKKMPNVKIYGIDIREDLLKIAKNCKKGLFLKLDIGKKFDRKKRK